MVSNRRDPAMYTRPGVPAGAHPGRESLEQASDAALIVLISQGDATAFATLFDRTSPAARAELATLPEFQAGQILAASYVEVWWLAGCHRAPEVEATSWIIGIVRRRVEEARRAMARPGADPVLPGLRPSYPELEIAALLRRPFGGRRR